MQLSHIRSPSRSRARFELDKAMSRPSLAHAKHSHSLSHVLGRSFPAPSLTLHLFARLDPQLARAPISPFPPSHVILAIVAQLDLLLILNFGLRSANTRNSTLTCSLDSRTALRQALRRHTKLTHQTNLTHDRVKTISGEDDVVRGRLAPSSFATNRELRQTTSTTPPVLRNCGK